MTSPPLDRVTNTPEAFTANQSGQLTPAQQQTLLRNLDYDLHPPIEWPALTQDWQLAIVGLIVGWVLSFYIGLPLWIMGLFSLLAGVAYIGEAVFKWGGLNRSEQAKLKLARQRLMTGDYQIKSWQGVARFEVSWQMYWYLGKQQYRRVHFIQTPLQEFPVSEALWLQFSAYAQEGLILHYLTEPLVTLLSVGLIPPPEPPTDAELASVIGFGDDGELIYEEQGENNRNTT